MMRLPDPIPRRPAGNNRPWIIALFSVAVWSWATMVAWISWRLIEEREARPLAATPWHLDALAWLGLAIIVATALAFLATGWLWLPFLEDNVPENPASVRPQAWMYSWLASTVGSLALWLALAFWGQTLAIAVWAGGGIIIGWLVGIRLTRKLVYHDHT